MTCLSPSVDLWQRMPWNLGHPASSLRSPPWPAWFLAGQVRTTSSSDASKSPHTEPPMHQPWGCSGWSSVPRGGGGKEGAVPDPEALPCCGEQSPEPRYPGQRAKAADSWSCRLSHFLIYLVNILVPQSVKSIT